MKYKVAVYLPAEGGTDCSFKIINENNETIHQPEGLAAQAAPWLEFPMDGGELTKDGLLERLKGEFAEVQKYLPLLMYLKDYPEKYLSNEDVHGRTLQQFAKLNEFKDTFEKMFAEPAQILRQETAQLPDNETLCTLANIEHLSNLRDKLAENFNSLSIRPVINYILDKHRSEISINPKLQEVRATEEKFEIIKAKFAASYLFPLAGTAFPTDVLLSTTWMKVTSMIKKNTFNSVDEIYQDAIDTFKTKLTTLLKSLDIDFPTPEESIATLNKLIKPGSTYSAAKYYLSLPPEIAQQVLYDTITTAKNDKNFFSKLTISQPAAITVKILNSEPKESVPNIYYLYPTKAKEPGRINWNLKIGKEEVLISGPTHKQFKVLDDQLRQIEKQVRIDNKKQIEKIQKDHKISDSDKQRQIVSLIGIKANKMLGKQGIKQFQTIIQEKLAEETKVLSNFVTNLRKLEPPETKLKTQQNISASPEQLQQHIESKPQPNDFVASKQYQAQQQTNTSKAKETLTSGLSVTWQAIKIAAKFWATPFRKLVEKINSTNEKKHLNSEKESSTIEAQSSQQDGADYQLPKLPRYDDFKNFTLTDKATPLDSGTTKVEENPNLIEEKIESQLPLKDEITDKNSKMEDNKDKQESIQQHENTSENTTSANNSNARFSIFSFGSHRLPELPETPNVKSENGSTLSENAPTLR